MAIPLARREEPVGVTTAGISPEPQPYNGQKLCSPRQRPRTFEAHPIWNNLSSPNFQKFLKLQSTSMIGSHIYYNVTISQPSDN
jgi:hypothetical protein